MSRRQVVDQLRSSDDVLRDLNDPSVLQGARWLAGPARSRALDRILWCVDARRDPRRSYLDTLTAALVVDQLKPWYENVSKRQVKSPKVYLNDSGLLHALLDLESRAGVERHPVLGASWEGFMINQIIAAARARPDQRYFWATHKGAQLDLLLTKGTTRTGFEIERTSAPKLTRSLRSAIDTLRLDHAYVVHAGNHTFPLADGVEAIAARDLLAPTAV